MQGLSKTEIRIVSHLEFEKKQFFTAKDVDAFANDTSQRYNIIKALIRKGRIVKLNRCKYYLIPVKAKNGCWGEYPEIIADEMMDGRDYFIGGWFSANYWRLTDQFPMQIDVYTTRRQGKTRVMNARFVFHRTTRKRVEQAVTQKTNSHDFRILGMEESRQWMKSRS